MMRKAIGATVPKIRNLTKLYYLSIENFLKIAKSGQTRFCGRGWGRNAPISLDETNQMKN